jgi:hypothetical protein
LLNVSLLFVPWFLGCESAIFLPHFSFHPQHLRGNPECLKPASWFHSIYPCIDFSREITFSVHNMNKSLMTWVLGIIGTTYLILVSGCSSTPSNQSATPPPQSTGVIINTPPPLPEGVVFRKDKDLQEVWLAPGFNFQGYDTLYISNTVFKAIERPNEVKMRQMAMESLPDQLVVAARPSGLFKTVTTATNNIPANSRTLTLYNTIIEYEKGGGGARYFAGMYGAGQPVIKVRGLLYDGPNLVFAFEAKRSGDSAMSRVFGGFMGDDTIQQDDIRDLTADLVGFMKRTADGNAQSN